MAPHKSADALAKELQACPPPGSPYGLPVPGSQQPGRSHIYRHHLFVNQPLLTTLDPEVQTIHDMFEKSAVNYPAKRCLGTRHWIPATKTYADKYEWLTYAEVAERRKNIGAGIVEIHKRINFPKDKYGVGLWSQNRAEWQLVGKWEHCETRGRGNSCCGMTLIIFNRSRIGLPSSVHRLTL